MIRIGIVGCGFVGSAVECGFNTPDVVIFKVDPKLNTTVDSLFESFTPDAIFIAVPTPMAHDGSINSSAVTKVIDEISTHTKQVPVIIKSTITPDVLDQLYKYYPQLVYNPEFLTESNANEDFIHADFLLLGGDPELCSMVEEFYINYSKCDPCPTFIVDLKAASLIKYTLNSFMASKVSFFNQVHDIFKNTNSTTSWQQFVEVIGSDTRVGKTHMQVPGPDGRYGFGGACFPKDTTAFIKYASDKGIDFTILKEVVKSNQTIRKRYGSDLERESSQGVNYDAV